MRRHWIIALLGVGVLGVGIEYWVLFGGASPTEFAAVERWDDELDPDDPDEATPARLPPEPLLASALAAIAANFAGETRSPFRTRTAQSGVPGALGSALPRLSGTLISRRRSIAWLNGQPRMVGEKIGVYEVEAIEAERAVLRSGPRRHELVVSPEPAAPALLPSVPAAPVPEEK